MSAALVVLVFLMGDAPLQMIGPMKAETCAAIVAKAPKAPKGESMACLTRSELHGLFNALRSDDAPVMPYDKREELELRTL